MEAALYNTLIGSGQVPQADAAKGERLTTNGRYFSAAIFSEAIWAAGVEGLSFCTC